MNAFEIQTGSSEAQAKLTQVFQQEKIDFIQTARGLCLKTSSSQAELEACLAKNGVTGTTFSPVAGSDSPDVRAFLDANKN